MFRIAATIALCLAFAASPALADPAPAPAPAAATGDVPTGILPDAVAPSAYRLDLTIDPAKDRFSGAVEIDAMLKRPSASLFIHGRDLAVSRAEAHIGGRTYKGTWRQVDPTGVATLTFAEPLPPGLVTFAFAYDAAFADGPQGMFHARIAERWYSWSQFESIDARAAFPAFDQPSYKTPFTVTLRTPAGLSAVSNAPETGSTLENGMTVHRFAPTLPLPTYLVAMMVGPFAHVDGAVAPTPQRAAALPLRVISPAPNAEKLDFALENSKQIVALLEDYFGTAFPYPKLDQITSPLMPGAMENAGADLYQDSIVVMDAQAPIADKRNFGMVVSHELAHQWFGDLVTPAWWDDIWLNESFANWMGYRIGGAWRPDLNIAAGALAEGFRAMDTDELTVGRPIRQPIRTNAEIDAAFDTITYGKGGQVVAMIAGFMGDDKFREGVRRYMAAHRYGNATSRDFFGAMAEAAGDPRIVPAMQSFTDQQGVPLLAFARDATGWTVTQSRYAPLGAKPPEQLWGVPMCVRLGQDRACQLVTERTVSLKPAGGAGAIVPNAGGTGYYRFELPAADWSALSAQAASLTSGEGIAAADSLGASVRAGRARVSQLATLAVQLLANPDSHAADAGMAELRGLIMSGVVGKAGTGAWRRFVGNHYRALLDRYGFDPRAGAYANEDPETAQRRLQIVALMASAARDGGVRKQLDAAAAAYLAGDAKALDPMYFEPAFDAYIGRRGMKGAKLLIERALASSDPSFRPIALNSVSSAGWQPIARWLLEDFSDPRLRPDEKRDFLLGVLSSRTTARLGYDWMKPRIDTLLSGNGGIFYAARLPEFLGRFCSVAMADEMNRDLSARFAGKTGELALRRVMEKVRNCGVLADQKGAELTADFARLK